MTSGLPLKEIKVLLNRPGEELDERFNRLTDLDLARGGYMVELDGNLTKNAQGEVEFSGTAHTITLPTEPIGGELGGGYKKSWGKKGKGDVHMMFWFEMRRGEM